MLEKLNMQEILGQEHLFKLNQAEFLEIAEKANNQYKESGRLDLAKEWNKALALTLVSRLHKRPVEFIYNESEKIVTVRSSQQEKSFRLI